MNRVDGIVFKVKGHSVSVSESAMKRLPAADKPEAYRRLRALGSCVAGFASPGAAPPAGSVAPIGGAGGAPPSDAKEALVAEAKDISAEMRKRYKESGFKASYSGKAALLKRLKVIFEKLLTVVGDGERQGPAVFYEAIREAPDSLDVGMKVKEMVYGKRTYSDWATERGHAP